MLLLVEWSRVYSRAWHLGLPRKEVRNLECKPAVATHSCVPSTQEADTGRSQVHGQSELCCVILSQKIRKPLIPAGGRQRQIDFPWSPKRKKDTQANGGSSGMRTLRRQDKSVSQFS